MADKQMYGAEDDQELDSILDALEKLNDLSEPGEKPRPAPES